MWSKISDYTNGPSVETNTEFVSFRGEGLLCSQARHSMQPRIKYFCVERVGNPMWPGQEFNAAKNFSSDLWYPFMARSGFNACNPEFSFLFPC